MSGDDVEEPSDMTGPEVVNDLETFVAFVQALAEERRRAESIEAADPNEAIYGSPLGWQWHTISDYLDNFAAYFVRVISEREESASISWKDLADGLYYAKVYE